MILSFKTKIDGKPTYFVEKILKTFDEKECSEADKEMLKEAILEGFLDILKYDEVTPKIHTIRKDKKNRWKPGMMIDFFINARQKDMFRFAPRIPLKSRQKIFMTYLPHCGLGFRVSINGRELDGWEVEKLAINDGFEAVEDFEDYFINEMEDDQFSGKILHWTDLRY